MRPRRAVSSSAWSVVSRVTVGTENLARSGQRRNQAGDLGVYADRDDRMKRRVGDVELQTLVGLVVFSVGGRGVVAQITSGSGTTPQHSTYSTPIGASALAWRLHKYLNVVLGRRLQECCGWSVAEGSLQKATGPDPVAAVRSILGAETMTAGAWRVLVIDSDSEIRDVVEDLLFDRGFEVSQAADMNEAVLTLRDRTFDVLLCHLTLLRATGDPLSGVLRKLEPAPRIVAMSASGAHARDDEANASLSKPFTRSQLEKSLRPGKGSRS